MGSINNILRGNSNRIRSAVLNYAKDSKRSGIVDTIQNIALGFDSVGNVDALKAASSFRLATGMSATGAIGLAGAVGAGAGAVSGVMDDTGPIDGGLGGLATGVLASAAVVGGAVMTKQGRKVVDRIGKGRFKGQFEQMTSKANARIDGMNQLTGGKGDAWSNFSKDIYSQKDFGIGLKGKPAKTGSDLGTATQTTSLQQTTDGANPSSVASQSARKITKFRGIRYKDYRLPSDAADTKGRILDVQAAEAAARGSNSAKKGAMTRAKNNLAKKQQEEAALANRNNSNSDFNAEMQEAERRASYRFDMLQNLQESESRSQIPLPRITMKQGSITQTVKPLGVKRQNQAQRQASTQQLAERINPVTTGGIGTATLANAGSSKVTRAAEVQTLYSTRNSQRNRQRR